MAAGVSNVPSGGEKLHSGNAGERWKRRRELWGNQSRGGGGGNGGGGGGGGGKYAWKR
jgi:hypothetical protein